MVKKATLQYKKQYIVTNSVTGKEAFYDELAEYLPTPSCYKEQGAVYLVGRDHKYGLIDTEGTEIIPPIYDAYCGNAYDRKGNLSCGNDIIFDFADGYFIVRKDNKFGIIDSNGQVVFPFLYEEIRSVMSPHYGQFFIDMGRIFLEESLITVWEGNHYGIAKVPSGELLVELQLDQVCPREYGFDVQKDDKWGIIGFDGREIVKCNYDTRISLSYKYNFCYSFDVSSLNEIVFIKDDGKIVHKEYAIECIRYPNSQNAFILKKDRRYDDATEAYICQMRFVILSESDDGVLFSMDYEYDSFNQFCSPVSLADEKVPEEKFKLVLY